MCFESHPSEGVICEKPGTVFFLHFGLCILYFVTLYEYILLQNSAFSIDRLISMNFFALSLLSRKVQRNDELVFHATLNVGWFCRRNNATELQLWIGLRYVPVECDDSDWFEDCVGSWLWLDDTPMANTFEVSYEDDFDNMCVLLKDTALAQLICSEEMMYLCERGKIVLCGFVVCNKGIGVGRYRQGGMPP